MGVVQIAAMPTAGPPEKDVTKVRRVMSREVRMQPPGTGVSEQDGVLWQLRQQMMAEAGPSRMK